MNLKTIVWMFLMSFVILVGNILLFGIGGNNFLIYYTLFALGCVFIIIYSVRNSLSNKSEYVIVIILGLLFVSSAVFCANSLKEKFESSKDLTSYREQILQEDVLLEQKNQYYISYINYTRDMILLYKNQSELFQFKASEIMLKFNESKNVNEEVIASPILPIPDEGVVPLVYYKDDYYERYDGERDDD